jgi:hypothetical protein
LHCWRASVTAGCNGLPPGSRSRHALRFGTGRTSGLSPSGSKVVALDWGRPGGAAVYPPTASTEVHDELLEVTVQAVLGECPKRKRGGPGWFVEAKSILLPLIAARGAAVTTLELSRSGFFSQTALKAAVRRAKSVVKHAVAAAKEAWWTKHVSHHVNAIQSSATAWE